MATKPQKPQLLGTSATARLLNVSDNTITRWANEGRLAHMRDSSGKRLFTLEVVAAAMRKRQKQTNRKDDL